MKSVLISTNPKWCELIASGKKTIEVRKTKPKLETPFKVYIYETQGRTETPFVDEEGHHIFKGRGQVIGEFVCDNIITAGCGYYVKIPIEESQIVPFDLVDYADGKTIYGWHISDLVIYDKPRELSEFSRHDNSYDNCFGWAFEDRAKSVPIKRPPQSWCYVEDSKYNEESCDTCAFYNEDRDNQPCCYCAENSCWVKGEEDGE